MADYTPVKNGAKLSGIHPEGVERVQPGVSTPGTPVHGGAPCRGGRLNVATTQVKRVRISRPFRANHLFWMVPRVETPG
jgi:hypothetical protein